MRKMMTAGRLTDSRPALAVYGLTLAVFYAASFFPDERLWGINNYGYFSWYGPLVLLLLGGLLILPTLRFAPGAPGSTDGDNSGKRFAVMAIALTIAMTVSFIVFRGRTHLLGDGYQLLAWLVDGVHNKPWESGTYAVQRLVFNLFGGEGEAAGVRALRYVSWGSGLLFLSIAAIGSRRLFDQNHDRLLLLAGMATGGYALLFFGYFESYPLFAAAVLLFSMVGLLVVRGRLHRFWLVPALLLAGWFHIFAVGLAPAAVYLWLRETAVGRALAKRPLSFKVGLLGATLVVALAVLFYLYSSSYFIRFTIVPFWENRFTVQGYTMFSWKHLLDWLNLVFSLCPGLPVFLILLLRPGSFNEWRRPDRLYLGLLAAVPLAMTFLFNPGLGMPRDWDLFSFAGIPLNLLCFSVALQSDPGGEPRRLGTALAVALGLLGLLPRVAIQAAPDKGLALFDVYAELDVVRSRNGRYWELAYLQQQGDTASYRRHAAANRIALPHEGWAQEALELAGAGRSDEAMELLHRAVRFAPCYPYAWSNLGTLYERKGQYDSALTCLEIAGALMPFNASIYSNTGVVYSKLGDTARAELLWKKALKVDSTHYSAGLALLRLYYKQERTAERDLLLERLDRTENLPPDIQLDITAICLEQEHWPAGRRWLDRSIRAGADSAAVERLKNTYPDVLSSP